MRFLIIPLFALLSFTALVAQPKQNSPYSRFGLGDLQTRFLPVQGGMGGLTTANQDPFHLNLNNPASLAFLRSTAYETGLFAKYSHYDDGTTTQDAWSGNLTYLALGFTLKSPINEILDKDKSPWKYGMGFSLAPYSQVGYLVETKDSLPSVGNVVNDFEGSGGIYRLAWSSAARYKNTSMGLNLGWNFGRATYENTTIFTGDGTIDDFEKHFQNNFREEYSVRGISWNLGVQHNFVLETAENDKDVPTRWITVGLTGEGTHKLRTESDILSIRSRGKLGNGTYKTADTLENASGVRQSLTLPATLSLGVQYVKADKLKLGAQLGLEQWSGYDNEVRPETLRNTLTASAGVEFIPNATSYNQYIKRIRYRAGGYYRQDPRIVGAKNLDDLGLTLGMGFPLVLPRQQTSFVNFSLELGKFGANSPISEMYGRLTLGFTLNDNTWFFKRRFE